MFFFVLIFQCTCAPVCDIVCLGMPWFVVVCAILVVVCSGVWVWIYVRRISVLSKIKIVRASVWPQQSMSHEQRLPITWAGINQIVLIFYTSVVRCRYVTNLVIARSFIDASCNANVGWHLPVIFFLEQQKPPLSVMLYFGKNEFLYTPLFTRNDMFAS